MSAELFVSVDLDGLQHHLRGYGAARASTSPESDAVLALALPRFLDLFARLGVRATFFAIAEDAAAGASHLRRAVDAGHEIASHSLTHPLPFTSLPQAALRDEVERSKDVLQQACGVAVRGFRAPGFGVSPYLLGSLAAAGYAYDSSVVPSPSQLLQVVWFDLVRGTPPGRGWRHSIRYAFSRRAPYRHAQGVWELPITVTPLLRIPVYHTPRLALGPACFRWLAASITGAYAQYLFHGIDLLDAAEVDAALLGHPGSRLPLAEKLAIAEESLRLLLRGRTPRRLDELAGVAAAQGSTTATPIGRGAAARSILTLASRDLDSGDKM